MVSYTPSDLVAKVRFIGFRSNVTNFRSVPVLKFTIIGLLCQKTRFQRPCSVIPNNSFKYFARQLTVLAPGFYFQSTAHSIYEKQRGMLNIGGKGRKEGENGNLATLVRVVCEPRYNLHIVLNIFSGC